MDNSTAASGKIRVTINAHWVNKALLIPMATPFARIDGTEHACQWGKPSEFDVDEGEHVVETYIRYKKSSSNLGTADTRVTIEAGETVEIASRNGWMNQTPFRPRVVTSNPNQS